MFKTVPFDSGVKFDSDDFRRIWIYRVYKVATLNSV